MSNVLLLQYEGTEARWHIVSGDVFHTLVRPFFVALGWTFDLESIIAGSLATIKICLYKYMPQVGFKTGT